MSNMRSRKAFYQKHEAKCKLHKTKINFFKPRTAQKQQAPKSSGTTGITTYVSKPKPIPVWEDAKQQVFSSSSSAPSDYDSEMADCSNGSSGKHGLWAAAANRSDNYRPHPHDDNFCNSDKLEATAASSSADDIWAEAVNPADYADCVSISAISCDPATTFSPTIASAPTHSQQHNQSTTNSTINFDNDDDPISFNPPEILGHHLSYNKHSADPNTTILE